MLFLMLAVGLIVEGGHLSSLVSSGAFIIVVGPTVCAVFVAYGFEKPSAIQQRAIRPIVRGRDVIAQSQSGTGKTAVFSISTLQLLQHQLLRQLRRGR